MPTRRVLLGALAGGLLAAPLAAEAQQPSKAPKIGFLSGASQAGLAVLVQAFKQGMREIGYVDGKTFVFEGRYVGGRSETIPELARELVALKVDVIVASTDAPIARSNERLGRSRS